METKHMEKILWTVLFSLITGGSLMAWSNPATEYELSIYAETPLSVWVILSFVILVSVILLFNGKYSRLGYVSAGLAVICWSLMRIIRGYYIIGTDMLVHLGSIKEILSGLPTSRILYPHMYVLSIILSQMTGLSPRTTLWLTIPLIISVLIIFVPLATHVVNQAQSIGSPMKSGFLVGLCILPINWLGTNLSPHPASYAVFFSPILYFAVFRGMRSGSRQMGVLSLIFCVAMVYLHPMIAMLTAISLLGIGGTLFLVRKSNQSIREVRTNSVFHLLGVCIFLGVHVVFYLTGYKSFQGTFLETVQYFTESSSAAASPSGRVGRLSQIGRSPYIIAIKYIGANVVASVAALISVIISANHFRRNEIQLTDLFIFSILGAILALSIGVSIFLVAGMTFYFRVLGLVMVLLSILAPIGLYYIPKKLHWEETAFPTKIIQVSILILLIGFSLPLMHPSPYIATPSDHTTKAEVATVETGVLYGISAPVIRVRAHYSRREFFVTGNSAPIMKIQPSDHFNNRDLPSEFEDNMYLYTTQSDYETDVILYKGFRFNKGDFMYLNKERKLDKIITSGSADIYVISK